MSAPIREPAPAKVNPFLRVLGRRSDGFHDIETLIQPITLADGVEASEGEGLLVAVAGPAAEGVPTGEGNLAARAARALAETASVPARARLLIAKQIPVGAGLGGGSADAAAALRALNDLWGCGLGPEELAAVGAGVGSDVPALVLGGTVLATGRGARVERVSVARTWWVVLPLGFTVASADAYAWWDEGEGTGPDPDSVLGALRAGMIEAAAPLLYNDLEGPVARRHPEVAEGKERLLEAGALAALMSGSGPTVVGLCRDGRHAEEVAERVGGIAASSVRSLGGG